MLADELRNFQVMVTESANETFGSKFLTQRMERRGIRTETIRLVNHQIPAGTASDMCDGDEWPWILEQVLAADIVILATPIWWSNQSSLIQRVIERLETRFSSANRRLLKERSEAS
jgi:multimeric flavodoxin WrbA